MDQLLLDLVAQPPPTFANFVTGDNQELVASLRALSAQPQERFHYVWGEAGCGKTHLLRAAVAAAGVRGRYLTCGADLSQFPQLEQAELIALDDVDRLSDAGQVALFHRYNEARSATGVVIVASGADAPHALRVRPELSSRLAWGLVYRLHTLTDAEKAAALAAAARERGFDLAPELVRYLLSHRRRDLPSLMALVDRLDRYSIAVARPITLPLLKRMLEKD